MGCEGGCGTRDRPAAGGPAEGASQAPGSTTGEGAAPGQPAPAPAEGPPVPVTPPPESARRTQSGLAIQVLEEGSGDARVGPHDRVEVYYSTWTSDGALHFSTRTRRAPATFELRDASPGMREGIVGMRKGEKRRLWIPEALARVNARSPKGPVLSEVELLRVRAGEPPIPPPADVAQAPADALQHAAGFRQRVVAAGTGSGGKPAGYDRVTIKLTSWSPDGTMTDTTERRAGSDTLVAAQAPPGVTEALREMAIGERRLLWVPAAMMRTAASPTNEARVFDVTLVAMQDMPDPPAAPTELQPPTRSVQKTASGLVYRVLRRGRGKAKVEHPGKKVDIHFTGWTAEGKLFSTTVTQDYPHRTRVSGTIPGFQEVLPQMVVGEKRRLWLPAKLAHGGEPARPQGPVIYDLELTRIY